MNTFSIKRIVGLLKEHYSINLKKELLMLLIPFGICFLIFFVGGSSAEKVAFTIFTMVAYSLFLAFGAFSQLGKKSKAMNYLILPASCLEKTIATFIRVHVLQAIPIVIVSLLGVIAGIIAANNRLQFVYESYTMSRFFYALINSLSIVFFLFIILSHSVAIFSSVYFKRKALPKFILFLFLFGIAISILQWITASLFLDYSSMGEFMMSIAKIQTQIDFVDWKSGLVLSILTLFFYFLTCLRLRETEVK